MNNSGRKCFFSPKLCLFFFKRVFSFHVFFLEPTMRTGMALISQTYPSSIFSSQQKMLHQLDFVYMLLFSLLLNFYDHNYFADLHNGHYVLQPMIKCNMLCGRDTSCCDVMASCRCGTHTGKYECMCKPGYFGYGLYGDCIGKKLFEQ